MNRTRIKICGITRPGDAVLAAEAGADAVGLIMQQGAARFVPLDRAREIVKTLPPLATPVAVFVNQTDEEIRQVATAIGVGQVQLHGEESPELVRRLFPLRAIKAIRATRDNFRDVFRPWKDEHFFGFVLDTASAHGRGGTGEPNDWGLVKAIRDEHLIADRHHLIVAGGLTPENVGDVVRLIRPWAVDVSSGVESSVGIKSIEKIQAFISAVRAADEDV